MRTPSSPSQKVCELVLAGLLVLPGLAACEAEANPIRTEQEEERSVPGGDPERGWALVQSYGCETCHTIPGVPSADALVGPPLTAWADRQYIAGALDNNPENLIFWIMEPQTVEPGTAMPNMGVSEADARDIAAYLYTLDSEDD